MRASRWLRVPLHLATCLVLLVPLLAVCCAAIRERIAVHALVRHETALIHRSNGRLLFFGPALCRVAIARALIEDKAGGGYQLHYWVEPHDVEIYNQCIRDWRRQGLLAFTVGGRILGVINVVTDLDGEGILNSEDVKELENVRDRLLRK